jgi:Tfp pilus assembly protein PilX
MFERIWRDESGIALGLAIMVMVIVGVMGAGLLVFVRHDLEAVVEVNQGQRAMDAAEAGVQAAKRQLLSNATRQHYDRQLANDCAGGNRRTTAEDWSPLTTIYNDPTDCGSGTTTRPQGASPGTSPGAGST